MKVFRRDNLSNRGYTKISNGLLQDPTITYEMKGLICALLSYPPEHEITVKSIVKAGKGGRDKAYRMIAEAIKHDYIQKDQSRTGGKFATQNYTVTDDPMALIKCQNGPKTQMYPQGNNCMGTSKERQPLTSFQETVGTKPAQSQGDHRFSPLTGFQETVGTSKEQLKTSKPAQSQGDHRFSPLTGFQETVGTFMGTSKEQLKTNNHTQNQGDHRFSPLTGFQETVGTFSEQQNEQKERKKEDEKEKERKERTKEKKEREKAEEIKERKSVTGRVRARENSDLGKELFEDLGHGVSTDGKTVRHKFFRISITALEMLLALQMRTEDAKRAAEELALYYAICWAGEIEEGGQPEKILPSSIPAWMRKLSRKERLDEEIQKARLKEIKAGNSFHDKELARKKAVHDMVYSGVK